MGRSTGRIVAFATGATTLLASCTLIDLSGLQGGAGGYSASTTSDVTGATSASGSSSSGAATGGGGGSAPVIHKLYVAGGRAVTGKPLDTIFTTTIADDGTLDPFDSVVQTLPEVSEEAGLALVDSRAFLIGGLSVTGTTVVDRATGFVADLGADGTFGAWTMMPATLPSGGYANFGTATDSNHIFLAGGSNIGGSFTTASILRGDIVNDTIQMLNAVASSPAATENEGLLVAEGELIVLGGSASPKQVLVATLSADGTIGTLTPGPSFNENRNTSCAAVGSVAGATRIYVTGGSGPPSLSSIEVATLTGGVLGAWQTSSVLLDAGRIGSGCFVLGSSLYVIGGVLDSNASTDEVARIQLDPQSGQPVSITLERPLPAPRGHGNVLLVDLKGP